MALLGLLPVLPMLVAGSPVLNNDMLVAYFCYFWDFHRNWSWDHPIVSWSSSYQAGMPMHAYWQSGYLYPVTWILFGPLSPHLGIHLFYAFHFSLGMAGFLALGPRMGLKRPAALWAGIAFALSGTMLARYEHATFLSGWSWLPLVLAAFLALRDRPGPRNLFLYAGAVALQALGGHPQASATAAVLIGLFTVGALWRSFRARGSSQGNGEGTRPRAAAWMLAGHLLALAYCTPLVVPFLTLVDGTNRYDGAAWEGKGSEGTAEEKLESGVFGFEKFSTGGLRPLHLLSLGAAHALGSPSNASWWGGEAWGEVFLYLGVLGIFFCAFASWKRAGPDLRLLWIVGLFGLWLSFGAHLGASQILYHVPVFNNFRRPARFLILVAFALAALSAHGYQRWTGKPRGGRAPALLGVAGLLGAAAFLALRLLPEANAGLLDAVRLLKPLDPAKDYGGKIAALAGRLASDCACVALSGLALWWASRAARPRAAGAGAVQGITRVTHRRGRGLAHLALFAVLALDLLRIHWDHFYLFPSSFYREPPRTAAFLDSATSPFWRVSHYLEYPGLEMWRMHNDPLAHLPLFQREKDAYTFGVHAVFGVRHASAHLPLMWPWDRGTGLPEKSARYFFSNVDLDAYAGDSLDLLGKEGEVRAYAVRGWKPRYERRTASGARRRDETGAQSSHSAAAQRLDQTPAQGTDAGASTVAADAQGRDSAAARRSDSTACAEGFSGWDGLCVREARDGRMEVRAAFGPGDTLVVRERAYPGWVYRVGRGEWRPAPSSSDHFLALPLETSAESVEIAFVPFDLYRWSGFVLILTGVLSIFAVFRRRGKLSLARSRPPA